MSIGFIAGKARVPKRGASDFETIDFIPQAVFQGSVAHFSKIVGAPVSQSSDDLDTFDGIVFVSKSINQPVAIRHYAGYPEGTVSVYLPRAVSDVVQITDMVKELAAELRLSASDKIWERKDNPEL
jgi:hypothetical protein